MVRMATGLYGGMLAVGVTWGVLRGLWTEWWRFESLRQVGEGAVAGATLGFVAILLSWQMDRVVAGVRGLSERFATILAGTSVREAVVLAALSSVGEEVLFRGCLQEEFGVWWATLLFALVHGGPERIYLWWTASAFVFGLGLAALYQVEGGLLGPIVMHFVINAVNIRMLGRRGDELVRRKRGSLGDVL